jgi:hypothetical protein
LSQLLFEKTLQATQNRYTDPFDNSSDTFFLEEDTAAAATTIIEAFASLLNDDDELDDWENLFEIFCDVRDLSEEAGMYLKIILTEFAKQNDTEVKGVLRHIAKNVVPGAGDHTDDESSVADIADGRIPSLPADALKALRGLKVSKHSEPFGNQHAFSAKKVRIFNRPANRYGYSSSAASQIQKSDQRQVLRNPTLNIRTENVYVAVDAVGLSQPHQWHVVNRTTNEIITPKMVMKTQAEEIAAQLNHDYTVALHEGTPRTSLEENLLRPLSADNIARFEAAMGNVKYSMTGSIKDNAYGSSQVADLKAPALLQEARRKAFGESENVPTELDSIHQLQKRTKR